MGKTNIDYVDYSFNPWWGCTKVSPGCANCYAEGVATRFNDEPIWGPTAPRRFFGQKYWTQPLAWNRKAQRKDKRFNVLCGSMCDVLEKRGTFNSLSDQIGKARQKLWELILATPRLDWLLLTKRPENFDLIPVWFKSYWPYNLHLGVSVEDQERADERIPLLLSMSQYVKPAGAKLWVSVEPMLGPVEITLHQEVNLYDDLTSEKLLSPTTIDWVILGGESGPNARPMHPDWTRSVRDQCQENGVPFFYKQITVSGTTIKTPMLDGYQWQEYPSGLERASQA